MVAAVRMDGWPALEGLSRARRQVKRLHSAPLNRGERGPSALATTKQGGIDDRSGAGSGGRRSPHARRRGVLDAKEGADRRREPVDINDDGLASGLLGSGAD